MLLLEERERPVGFVSFCLLVVGFFVVCGWFFCCFFLITEVILIENSFTPIA